MKVVLVYVLIKVLLSPVYLHCVFWFDAAENFFITLTEVIKLVSPHSLHIYH